MAETVNGVCLIQFPVTFWYFISWLGDQWKDRKIDINMIAQNTEHNNNL